MTTPKKGFIYSIMKGWANRHNNLQNFTHLHSLTWFIGLLLMVVVAAMAWWADYEVLYGIEFNNTHNHITSNTISIILACIIQVLILGCLGMAAKLVINKKYDSENRIQLALYSILGICGFSATIYLSYHTYSSASVKGLNALHNTHNTYNTLEDEVLGEADNATLAARKQYRRDSLGLVAEYGELIQAKRGPLEAKIVEKKIKADRGEIGWELFEEKKARYERGIANAVKPHIEEKTTALLSLLQSHTASLKKITDKRDRDLASLDKGLEGRLEDVEEATSLAAIATRGRNVGLNFISFLLCVGLLFFARGANKETSTPNIPSPLLKGATPLGMMGGAVLESVVEDEIMVDNNTPKTDKNAVVTPTTPQNTQYPPGSIQANKEDVWDVLDDGSCVVLHVGKKENKWRDKSWVKSQISNRTKKAHTSKTNEAKLNNAAWRDLWERKLALIKKIEEGGDVV